MKVSTNDLRAFEKKISENELSYSRESKTSIAASNLNYAIHQDETHPSSTMS